MPPDISEADWRVLRRVHPLALERYCGRALGEVESIVHMKIVDPSRIHGVEPFGCDVQFIPPTEPGTDTAPEL